MYLSQATGVNHGYCSDEFVLFNKTPAPKREVSSSLLFAIILLRSNMNAVLFNRIYFIQICQITFCKAASTTHVVLKEGASINSKNKRTPVTPGKVSFVNCGWFTFWACSWFHSDLLPCKRTNIIFFAIIFIYHFRPAFATKL